MLSEFLLHAHPRHKRALGILIVAGGGAALQKLRTALRNARREQLVRRRRVGGRSGR